MEYGGIYIHIPFCRRKCVYCDFYSLPLNSNRTDNYQKALLKEIEVKAEHFPLQAKTLYIGGGTPTVLPSNYICKLISISKAKFHLLPKAEITIEANPGTLTTDAALALRQGGANRISLGVQAMQDHLLTRLGRIHKRQDVLRSMEQLHLAGFKNINIDLMCGLPGQTVSDVIESIRQVLELGVKHISLYPLQVEPGTPLFNSVENGQVALPSDDLTLDMMQQAEKELTRSSFMHYEIANYAQAGYQSQHNLIYWHNETYLGFGPAAASYYKQRRWVNKPDLKAYLASLGEPEIELDKDSMSEHIAMAETVFLGLRLLKEGISRARFRKRYSQELDDIYGQQIIELVSKGLISDNGDSIRLTATGLPIANQVFASFL